MTILEPGQCTNDSGALLDAFSNKITEIRQNTDLDKRNISRRMLDMIQTRYTYVFIFNYIC